MISVRAAGRALVDRFAPGAVVLLYHRVTELDSDPQLLAVKPSNFEAQLDVLKSVATIVPLRELQETIARRGSGRGLAAITFDDGYADNFEIAKPLLEARAIPATVFVSSGFVRSGRGFPWDAPGPSNRPMTVGEVRALKSELIDVGAHTVWHPRLSSLSKGEQEAEIRDSKRELEEWLGAPVTAFAYPFGDYRDFTRASMRFARDAGFELACANYAGMTRAKTNRFAIPRVLVRDWTAGEFRERLRRFLP